MNGIREVERVKRGAAAAMPVEDEGDRPTDVPGGREGNESTTEVLIILHSANLWFVLPLSRNVWHYAGAEEDEEDAGWSRM